MNLFDFFLSDEKKIAKHTRRLTNRDSQPDDREASARWLAEKATPESILGLLSRLDLSLEHQLKDAGEKEFVYSLLSGLGAPGVEPLRIWLRQCKQFALPLRLLAEQVGEEASIDMALEMLEIERKKDDFKPAKKKGLLIWLSEIRDPRCTETAAPFLEDFDEGVRYAAAEVIIAQADDAGRVPLLVAVARPEEESNRLRVRIAEVFHSRRWSVGEYATALEETPPHGFVVRDGRLARASV